MKQNKTVVLITGASSGIGKAIAEFLHQKDFTVYGTSRNPDKVTGLPFSLLALDVRNPESIKQCVAELIQKEGRIDVLVNNAGVGITGPLEEVPMEQVRLNFETNLFGPLGMMQAVLPQMREQKKGLIINVTSIAGYMGLPYRGIYSASKGALELITEAMRMEVRQFGVKVTNVAPGDFATNIAAGRYHAPVVKGSAYEKVYGDTLKAMDEHVSGGSSPEMMAHAIHYIIGQNDPEVRYKVGAFMQKFSIILKRVLPGKMYEGMLMKHYGLK
jgi:NAD(P)-dependent dehydrogenase (short-subunit alcohol dehydrogenase family)